MQEIIIKRFNSWPIKFLEKIFNSKELFDKFIEDSYVKYTNEEFDHYYIFGYDMIKHYMENFTIYYSEKYDKQCIFKHDGTHHCEYLILDHTKEFRTNSEIIKIVRELNDPNYKIARIPDDVDWYFDSTLESVIEKHRTWCLQVHFGESLENSNSNEMIEVKMIWERWERE